MQNNFIAINPKMTLDQISEYTFQKYSEMTSHKIEAWNEYAKTDKTKYLSELRKYVLIQDYNHTANEKIHVPSSNMIEIGMLEQEIERVSFDGTLIKEETDKDTTSQISKGLAVTVPYVLKEGPGRAIVGKVEGSVLNTYHNVKKGRNMKHYNCIKTKILNWTKDGFLR